MTTKRFFLIGILAGLLSPAFALETGDLMVHGDVVLTTTGMTWAIPWVNATGRLTPLPMGSAGQTIMFNGVAASPTASSAITVSSAGSVDGGAIKAGTVLEAYIDPLVARLTDVVTSTTVFIRNDITAAQSMIGPLSMPGLAVGQPTSDAVTGQVKVVSTASPIFTSILKATGSAGNQGPNLGTAAADPSDKWTSDTEVLSADADYAYTTYLKGPVLRSTGMMPYGTIPSAAVFTGVEITMSAKSTAGASTLLHARTTDGTTYLTSDSYQALTTGFVTYTFGGAGNLLGATQGSLAGFYGASAGDYGVAIYPVTTSAATTSVSWIKLKLYYSLAGTDQVWSAGTYTDGSFKIAKSGTDLTSGTALTFAQATRNATFSGAVNTTGGVIEDTDNEDLVLRTNANANQLVLDSAGGVGIGTAAPEGLLHLYKVSADNIIYFDEYSATVGNLNGLRQRKSHSASGIVQTVDGDYQGRLGFQGATTGNAFAYGATIEAVQDGTSGASYVPTNMVFQTYSGSAVNTNQLVLHNDGKVGIGGVNPGALLDVLIASDGGVVKIGKTTSAGQSAGILMGYNYQTAGGSLAYNKVGIFFKQAASDSANGQGEFHICVNNAGDATAATIANSKVMVDRTGQVGVGNTAPGATVDVTGTIRASTTVTGTTGLVGGTLSATSATLSQITSLAHYIGGGNTRAQKPVMVFVGGTAASADPPAAWNELGAVYYDTDGFPYVCTIAGSPGTWLAMGSVACPKLFVLEPNLSGTMEAREAGGILQGLFAAEVEGTDTQRIRGGTTATTYRIMEQQDEISYVTTATLTIDGTVYQPVSYTPPRPKSNGHYEIRKGEQLEVTFPVAPRADQTVLFSANGYYEIGANARGWLGAFRNMQRLTLQRAKTWVAAREVSIRADAATALAAKQAQIDALKTRMTAVEARLTAAGH